MKTNCLADCCRDKCHYNCIRFLDSVNLVWEFYYGDVKGTDGIMYHNIPIPREFSDCPCGCKNLVAKPPVIFVA